MNRHDLSLPLDKKGYYIRSWDFADKPALLEYANNRAIWLNVRDRFPHPYLEEHADGWLEHVFEDNDSLQFAISHETKAIGAIGLEFLADVECKSANLGYWLAESYWGKGIATQAVKVCTSYAFQQSDIIRISAEVFSWNPGSIRVLEKAGFEKEGTLKQSVFKDGKILDKEIFALLR